MNRLFFASLVLATSPLALAATPATAGAQDAATTATPAATPNPTVGGAEMFPTKTIVENASTAPNLTTLVAAVKAAGLADTLAGPGPFTVFAPTNEAFGRLAPGTVDALLKPEQKAVLAELLSYHVVPGDLDAATLIAKAEAAGGSTQLMTVAGQPLTATVETGGGGKALVLVDAKGGKSYVTQYNVKQSNGVVHIVNSILVPEQKATPTPAATDTPAAPASDATDAATPDDATSE